jgi:hypothetical protein
LFLDF